MNITSAPSVATPLSTPGLAIIELDGSNYLVPIDDACRENPFVTDQKKGAVSNVGRGLARIEPESGTLVAFATKHGHLASDGGGENSPFATSLAKRIDTPGIEINRLFRLVHDDVYNGSGKKQEPFTYGQLSAQEFYFKAR